MPKALQISFLQSDSAENVVRRSGKVLIQPEAGALGEQKQDEPSPSRSGIVSRLVCPVAMDMFPQVNSRLGL